MPVTKKELITVSLISVYYQYIAVWHRSNIGEKGLCILILCDNYNLGSHTNMKCKVAVTKGNVKDHTL